MVSKEATKCTLTNSESDSETAPSLAQDSDRSLDSRGQPVKKRNKALQVRFKDICEAQNEQWAVGKGGKPVSYKVAYRKYMTMPARRSIPNVTKSTGVQTSPDFTKRYQTFPFERKKNVIKHAALVEDYRSHNNDFLSDVKGEGEGDSPTESSQCGVKVAQQTRALLHHSNNFSVTDDPHSAANCTDGPVSTDSSHLPKDTESIPNVPLSTRQHEYQVCDSQTKNKGLVSMDTGANPSAKRQLAHCDEASAMPLRTAGSHIPDPISWNSLTQVEGPESPSARCKRKKGMPLDGTPVQALPHSAGCSAQAQCRSGHGPGMSDRMDGPTGPSVGQIVPLVSGGDLKAQLQTMESLITSSQETIKVLLGVIQELEKGEAQREGLSYRTGQDTANCDTCRNSACIIYSVELDFKQQEDKLHPLMKKLCPTDDPRFHSLPYPHEVFTSTPKRRSKMESKKHARWKLWFL